MSAPPGNTSTYNQWTIGPVYYSALAMAETVSNGSQVLDITASSNLSTSSPAYVIYENGQPVRIAVINYVTDPTGANNVQFTFAIGGQVPSQVQVKYVSIPSM